MEPATRVGGGKGGTLGYRGELEESIMIPTYEEGELGMMPCIHNPSIRE